MSGAFTVPDILAPASADLNNKEYVLVDGVYHTCFYITGYGYPSSVGEAGSTPLWSPAKGSM